MARPNPKLPIYPRPVSPLAAGAIYTRPRDVIYQDLESPGSSDDDGEVRVAKRRRIEKLGQSYLRGDGLFILSAGLKGPIEKGWRNPWGRERKKSKAEVPETGSKGANEVPETEARPLKSKMGRVRAKDARVEDWLRRSSGYAILNAHDDGDGLLSSPTPVAKKVVDIVGGNEQQVTNKQRRSPETESRKLFEAPQMAGIGSSEPQAGEAICEGNAEQSEPENNGHKRPEPEIPLPAKKSPLKRRAWVSHAANANRAEFAAMRLKRTSLHTLPASTQLSPFEFRRVSEREFRPERPEESPTLQKQEAKAMAPPQKQITEIATTREDPKTNVNAEYIAPGTEDLDTRLPVQASHALSISTSAYVPALSTETSKTSLTNVPPSAQIQNIPIPTPSTEASNGDKMLEPLSLVQTNEGSLKAAAVPPENKTSHKATAPEEIATPRPQSKDGGATSTNGSHQLLIDIARKGLNLNTQDMMMMAGISPLTFSTVKKPAPKANHRSSTPATATKPYYKPKPTKRPSFAPVVEKVSSESSQSQGSIKGALRVAKKRPASEIVEKRNRLGAFSVGLDGMEEISDVDGEKDNQQAHDNGNDQIPSDAPHLPSLPSLFGPAASGSPKRLKSALKPSSTKQPSAPLSSHPFTSTKTSSHQDAQRLSPPRQSVDAGQNRPADADADGEGGGDDAFDLSGAIDDMGSYLSTWDAEKEASALAG